jgi:uncharacterized protein DUF4150
MGSVSVNPPKTPVTKGSNGTAPATIPNICKMPGPPAPFVPAPLPNIGKSALSPKDYSTSVKIEGNEVAIKGSTFESIGDIASKGTGGGLISANTHGITKFVGPGSMDVKIEGKNVQLLSDPMLNNCASGGSPPNAATLVGVLQGPGLIAIYGDESCPLCNQTHGAEGRLEETAVTQGEADELAAAFDRARDASIAASTPRVAELNAMTRRQRAPHQPELLRRRIELTTMIGVVKCRCQKIFAGNSSAQFFDVQAEMPTAWHSPTAARRLVDGQDRNFQGRQGAFADHIGPEGSAGRAIFVERWLELDVASELSRDGVTNQTYYPPGSCAAQQLLVLALDHCDRPMGLTERLYTRNPNPNPNPPQLLVRDMTPAGPGPIRPFTQQEMAGGGAIPPCGTCQVVLTMLMCGRPPKCAHAGADAEICRGPAGQEGPQVAPCPG